MPRIRCLYPDCIFVDEGYCTAAAIQIDPNQGCLTYQPEDDDSINIDEDLWDEDLNDDEDLVSWEAEAEEELDDNSDEDDWDE